MDDGSAGARRCLDAVKPAYEAAVAAGRAVGVGLGLKNSGLGNGFKEVTKAVVRFEADGTVEVRHGWTEMGQGVHTVAAQVAIEELGVEPDRVRVVVDTTRELGCRPDHGEPRHADGRRRGGRRLPGGAGGRLLPSVSTTSASTASTGPTSSTRASSTRSSTRPSGTPRSSS